MGNRLKHRLVQLEMETSFPHTHTHTPPPTQKDQPANQEGNDAFDDLPF